MHSTVLANLEAYMKEHPDDRAAIKAYADALVELHECSLFQAYRQALRTYYGLIHAGSYRRWQIALKDHRWHTVIGDWLIRNHPAKNKIVYTDISLHSGDGRPTIQLAQLAPPADQAYTVIIARVTVGACYLARHAISICRWRLRLAQRIADAEAVRRMLRRARLARRGGQHGIP